MKIRLMFCLMLLLTAFHVTAQGDDVAVVHVFNASANTILIGAINDAYPVASRATTTLYLSDNDPLHLNDGALPLDETFLAGHRYSFTYIGATPPDDDGFTDSRYTVVDMTNTPSDETTSVWWMGNFFADENAVMQVIVNDDVVIEAIAYGEWASFSAPIAYFDLQISVADGVIYQTDLAFGEPYYTAMVAFVGDHTGSMMRDFFPMTVDVVETDFLTWMDALTTAQIPPYEYATMRRLIDQAEMQADFLSDDRVILLPHDNAFNTLAYDTSMYFFNDEARLARLLNQHLLIKSEMPQDPTAPLITLLGDELPVQRTRGGLTIGNAGYITRLLLPNGSEVWLINAVLLPPLEE
jgi:hypothetical protein